MKVVVTGGSGFIGKSLLSALSKDPFLQILSISRSDPLVEYKNVRYYKEDLTNFSKIRSAIEKYNPQGIIHLAWIGVYNSDHMSNIQEKNYGILENLLISASNCNVNFFIGLGSQAEYGKYSIAIKEFFITKPHTKYGKIKKKSCELVSQFCSQAGIRYVWLRLFSSFGYGDNPSWLIPYVIESLLKEKRPKLTLGSQKWDYLYVKDVAEAIYQCMCLEVSGIYNLGSGEALTVKSIVQMIKELTGSKLELKFGEIPYTENQIFHLQANMEKLFAFSSWRPKYSVYCGLKETVDQYRSQYFS